MADTATDATKTPPADAKAGAKKSEKGITGFVKQHKAVAITVGIVLLVLIYYFFIRGGTQSATAAQNAAAQQQADQTAADSGASGLSDQQLSDLESAISGSVGLQGPSGTQGATGPAGPAGAGAIGHWLQVKPGKYGREWVAPTKTYAGYYSKQGKKEIWHPASNTAPKK